MNNPISLLLLNMYRQEVQALCQLSCHGQVHRNPLEQAQHIWPDPHHGCMPARPRTERDMAAVQGRGLVVWALHGDLPLPHCASA